MATSDWAYFAQCSRLKTKRTKRRLQKTETDKRLIHLDKLLLQIKEAKRNLAPVPLNPPIQKGWKREFVLRPDVARSKDAKFFQDLLDKVNETDYSDRKDFKVKRRKYGKKTFEVRPKRVKEYCDWLFQKLKLTDKEKLYFKEEWRFDHSRTSMRKVFVFIEPWRFVPLVKPNIITHARAIDPMLEQEEDEIENHLKRNNLRPRMVKIVYGGYNHRDRWKMCDKAKYDYIKNENLKIKQIGLVLED